MTNILRGRGRAYEGEGSAVEPARDTPSAGPVIEIPQDDPLHAYLLDSGGPVDVTALQLDSPTLRALEEAGTSMVVPLIAQGELVGTLNLGARLSDQPYSVDDRKLLANLASQVAPAVKVAQLVRQQEDAAAEKERSEQEMRVAALIQQTLLPHHPPALPGWEIDAYYRPARAVGGDFYDFHHLSDGRLGIVIGDVTDKGVPAALVMATCRSMLRSEAHQHDHPGAVLAAVNDALVDEIPEAMFVTCFYGVLDPDTGELLFANAGHNLPYVRTTSGISELRATGMPLGLMPDMPYDVETTVLAANDTMLLSSDGISEAHNPEGEMFGLPRLMGIVGGHLEDRDLTGAILGELDRWSAGGEQEDDVTLVIVRRRSSARASAEAFAEAPSPNLEVVDEFELASEDGNEKAAMERVLEAVSHVAMDAARRERLATAVAEATMNAIEHGNDNRPEIPVGITVLVSDDRLLVRIRDQGGGDPIPDAETPDLEAKLAGQQSPRGWGLFLIESMVDRMTTLTDNTHHTIELEMLLKEA